MDATGLVVVRAWRLETVVLSVAVGVFKLWCWRRLLRIPWIARNETSTS